MKQLRIREENDIGTGNQKGWWMHKFGKCRVAGKSNGEWKG